MPGKWSDISHEVDSLVNGVAWTPDTPDFLDKRAQRQRERTRPDISYTQTKTDIRAEAKGMRASFRRTDGADGRATIIQLERIDDGSSAGHAGPAEGGGASGRRSGIAFSRSGGTTSLRFGDLSPASGYGGASSRRYFSQPVCITVFFCHWRFRAAPLQWSDANWRKDDGHGTVVGQVRGGRERVHAGVRGVAAG